MGGRGLTEELAPGIPWDLGCHWLHSGSINPLARVADALGAWSEGDALIIITAGNLSKGNKLRKLAETAPNAAAIAIYEARRRSWSAS